LNHAISENERRSSFSAVRTQSALTARTWSLTHAGESGSQFFVLDSGTANLQRTGHEEIEIVAPAVVSIPAGEDGAFRLAAGSEGFHLWASDTLLWRVIGDSAPGSNLRQIIAAPVITQNLDPGVFSQIWVAADALSEEARNPGLGASSLIALQLGIVLLQLWRAHGVSAAPTMGPDSVVSRFRQLVELHFRDHLSIDRYAEILGVTRSRLRDLCIRADGRPPLAILHARLLEEGRRRLEQTDMSVEQIAYSLGFRDPPYFNRFFVRLEGSTPGAYRAANRKTGLRAEAGSFAAWP